MVPLETYIVATEYLVGQKYMKFFNQKSKMAATAAILRTNFWPVPTNLRAIWVENYTVATGWLLDPKNKQRLCWLEIQEGAHSHYLV